MVFDASRAHGLGIQRLPGEQANVTYISRLQVPAVLSLPFSLSIFLSFSFPCGAESAPLSLISCLTPQAVQAAVDHQLQTMRLVTTPPCFIRHVSR